MAGFFDECLIFFVCDRVEGKAVEEKSCKPVVEGKFIYRVAVSVSLFCAVVALTRLNRLWPLKVSK